MGIVDYELNVNSYRLRPVCDYLWIETFTCCGDNCTPLWLGFGARLVLEMKRLAPKDAKLRISAPQERLYSTWIGGSILASLDTFKRMWVSKKEYESEGARVLHRKFLWFLSSFIFGLRSSVHLELSPFASALSPPPERVIAILANYVSVYFETYFHPSPSSYTGIFGCLFVELLQLPLSNSIFTYGLVMLSHFRYWKINFFLCTVLL